MTSYLKKYSILILVFVALIGGGLYLYLNLESMITRQAEKIAANALGVAVDIDGMNISLSDRTVTIRGIKIANPDGFKQPHVMTTDTVSITLDTASQELIAFKDINVHGGRVILEINENGLNLADLKQSIDNQKQASDSTAEEKVRVIVNQMVIDTSVIESHVAFLDRDIASFTMPPMRFSNIGQGGNTHAGDALAVIISRYLSEAERQARRSQALSGVDIPGLGKIEQRINEAVEGIRGLFSR